MAGYLELFREWGLADPGAMAAQYALLTWLLRTDRRADAEAGLVSRAGPCQGLVSRGGD